MPVDNLLPPPFEDWPRPLAFVLSGGGGYGSVQVGMLQALVDRGIHADLIVGSSVGALHGAMLAAKGEQSLAEMRELWCSVSRRAVFGQRREIFRNLRRDRSLANFDRLTNLIETHLGVDRFDDLNVRFGAVATDVLTGEPELLNEGDLTPALLASAAVPGIFPSVEIGGRRYVDGGVVANVPIRQAIGFGAQSVLSLDASPAILASKPPTSLAGSVLHSVSLMLRSQRAHAVDDLAHRYRVAVLPSPTPPDMGSFNFGRTDELLDSSYRLTAATLERWAQDAVSRQQGR